MTKLLSFPPLNPPALLFTTFLILDHKTHNPSTIYFCAANLCCSLCHDSRTQQRSVQSFHLSSPTHAQIDLSVFHPGITMPQFYTQSSPFATPTAVSPLHSIPPLTSPANPLCAPTSSYETLPRIIPLSSAASHTLAHVDTSTNRRHPYPSHHLLQVSKHPPTHHLPK